MPFPLAHPAAVVPLKRYCPRWLSFPALVIGSVTPDVGYLFGETHVGAFSHRFLGSIGFCLPVGMLLVLLLYGFRLPLVRLLPAPQQQAFLTLCQRPAGPPWTIAISVLIGAWAHQLLDGFTHNGGWFVQRLPLLRTPLFLFDDHTARLCHVLWYAFSFVGVVWLFVLFEKWKRRALSGTTAFSRKGVLRDAVLVALAVVPIELVHHLISHNRLGLLVVAALCGLPIIGIVLKVTAAHKVAAKPPPDTQRSEAPTQPRRKGA